jgi:hypothetical protein
MSLFNHPTVLNEIERMKTFVKNTKKWKFTAEVSAITNTLILQSLFQ